MIDSYMVGLGVTELRPDVIDDTAVTAFTQGWCWALARALSNHTGSDIWAVTASNGGWHHFGIYLPANEAVIDIEGAWPLECWVSYWAEITDDETSARPLTDTEMSRLGFVYGPEEQQALDVAEMFVPAVLAAVGLPAQGHGTRDRLLPPTPLT